MSLGLLFSGQGTQHPAMLPWLDDAPAWACQPLVDRFGLEWRGRLADSGWAQRNAVAQPLLTAIGIATWRVLSAMLPAPTVIAGYSVGELAAFHAAGVIGAAEAQAIADERAELMDASTGGVATGLLSVADAPAALIAGLCRRHELAVAIRLGAGRVVLGGRKSALTAAAKDATDAGAKATDLALAVASHTPWMEHAVGPFAALLESIQFDRPRTALVCDHDAAVLWHPAELRRALALQLAETIRWDDCMNAVEERRVRCVLELGPGSALSRMWNSRNPTVPARSVDEFRTTDAIARWVTEALA